MAQGNVKRRRRKRKKSRRPPLFYIFIIFLALAIAIVVIVTTVFKINTIIVKGSTQYDKSEIKMIAGIYQGDNYFFIDKQSAIDQIEEKYSYLENTEITYQMFSTLVINVKDSEPQYAMPVDGGYALISENFKVLETPVIDLPEGIPEVKGLTDIPPVQGEFIQFEDESGTQKKTALNEVTNAMEKAGLENINSIDVTDLYDIRMIYDNRIVILFGGKTKAEKKGKVLYELIEVRYPSPQFARINCSTEEDEELPRSYVLPLTSLEQWDQLELERKELRELDPEVIFSSNTSSSSSSSSDSSSSSTEVVVSSSISSSSNNTTSE